MEKKSIKFNLNYKMIFISHLAIILNLITFEAKANCVTSGSNWSADAGSDCLLDSRNYESPPISLTSSGAQSKFTLGYISDDTINMVESNSNATSVLAINGGSIEIFNDMRIVNNYPLDGISVISNNGSNIVFHKDLDLYGARAGVHVTEGSFFESKGHFKSHVTSNAIGTSPRSIKVQHDDSKAVFNTIDALSESNVDDAATILISGFNANLLVYGKSIVSKKGYGLNQSGITIENNGSAIFKDELQLSMQSILSGTGYAINTSNSIQAEKSLSIHAIDATGIRINSGNIKIDGLLELSIKNTVEQKNAICGTNIAICITGDNSKLYANGGGFIQATTNAVNISAGKNSYLQLSGMNIVTSGDFSIFEVQSNNGVSSNTANDVNKISLINSIATSSNSGKGLLLNVGNNGHFIFDVNGSKIYGKIKSSSDSVVNMNLSNNSYLKGDIDHINLNVDTSSVWDVTGASSLYNLTNSGIISFSNENSLFHSITVDSYVGSGGKLFINTYLDNDSSVSDKLVITKDQNPNTGNNSGFVSSRQSGQAVGKTNIYVNNRGGLGSLTTGLGIQVIEAQANTTTNVDAFSLGHTVSAGAYEYTLHRDDNESWYLRSYKKSNVPDYSDESSGVSVLTPLAQLYNAATLSSWRERIGGMAYADTAQQPSQRSAVAPLWVRVGSGKGRHDGGEAYLATPSSTTYSPDYKYEINFLQMGGDLYQGLTANNARKAAGIFFTTGSINADVYSYDTVTSRRKNKHGQAKLESIALGAYWTYVAADGSYIDLVGQYASHDSSAQGNGDKLLGSGHSWAASVEAGKAYALNSQWKLAPQGQLRWQSIHMNTLNAVASGSKVGEYQLNGDNSLEARLGLEARYSNTKRSNVWARLDVLHEFKGVHRAQYSSLQGLSDRPLFTSNRQGTSVELRTGIDVELANDIALYGATSYRKGLRSQSGDHAWNLQLGIRWAY